MNISIDYDDTFTQDPILWLMFIRGARDRGHKVYCVTMRYPHEGWEVKSYLENRVDDIIFTSRKAKKQFLLDMGITVDVWIDDCPHFVFMDARINDQTKNSNA